MITDELGLRSGDARPKRAAWATFGAFCSAGMVPLLPFLFPWLASKESFLASCLATAMAFYSIGFLKARILSQRPWKSGWESLLLGGSAAIPAYGVGFGLSRLWVL